MACHGSHLVWLGTKSRPLKNTLFRLVTAGASLKRLRHARIIILKILHVVIWLHTVRRQRKAYALLGLELQRRAHFLPRLVGLQGASIPLQREAFFKGLK